MCVCVCVIRDELVQFLCKLVREEISLCNGDITRIHHPASHCSPGADCDFFACMHVTPPDTERVLAWPAAQTTFFRVELVVITHFLKALL